MHPRIEAERRAKAEARLSESLTILATNAGIETPAAPLPRYRGASDVFRTEALADIADALAGVQRTDGGEPVTDAAAVLTVEDIVRARLIELPRMSEERANAIIAAALTIDSEDERPLRERLLALDGVGEATADAVLEAARDAGVATGEDD